MNLSRAFKGLINKVIQPLMKYEMVDFSYTKDSILCIKEAMSEPRFAKYKQLTGDDNDADACRLCMLNAELSGVFLKPIQILEVTLRNSCDSVASQLYGRDWLSNGSIELADWQAEDVAKAQKKIGRSVCVADLSFGFWTKLLSMDFEESLWRPGLSNCFTDIEGKKITHKTVNRVFSALRVFRNRVAHHEQILTWQPERNLEKILMATLWLNSGVSDWVRKHEGVTNVWVRIQSEKSRRGWSGF